MRHLLLVLLVLMLPLQAAFAVQQEEAAAADVAGENDEYLRIHSSGYSRFEIEGDSIVAHMTGGVEFDYAEYRLFADEIRFNHETRRVGAIGNVEMESGNMQLSAGAALLDAKGGELGFSGGVSLMMAEDGTEFAASEAILLGDPGDEAYGSFELQSMRLTGDVAIRSERYGLLECSTCEYDVSEGRVHLNGSVYAKLNFSGGPPPNVEMSGEGIPPEILEQIESQSPQAIDMQDGNVEQGQPGSQYAAMQSFELTAHSATLMLTDQNEPANFKLEDAFFSSSMAELSAPLLELAAVPPNKEGAEPSFRLTGINPLGRFNTPDEEYLFQALAIDAMLAPDGLTEMVLADDVQMSDGSFAFTTGLVEVMRGEKGYNIKAVEGIAIGLDAAALGELDGCSLDSITPR